MLTLNSSDVSTQMAFYKLCPSIPPHPYSSATYTNDHALQHLHKLFCIYIIFYNVFLFLIFAYKKITIYSIFERLSLFKQNAHVCRN